MFRRAAGAGLLPGLVVSAVLIAAYFPLMRPVQLGPITLVCDSFNVGCGAPTVRSVSPDFGPFSGGNTVTITGTNFNTSPISVAFGSPPSGPFATGITVISDTQLTAIVPNAIGTFDVMVITSRGTSATSPADQFTFLQPTNSGCTTQQYTLTGSDGATWRTIDAARVSIAAAPSVDSYWILTGNADLWTSSIGYNQDLGITVFGGTSPGYPTTAGQPEAWKESGGSGGTYSPNAAAVQTVIPVKAGQTYAAALQWKANGPDPGTIWAGAGGVGDFSQTCIIGQLVPQAPATVVSKASTAQYSLTSSDGSTWKDMDATNLTLSIVAPADGVIVLGGNADLWTARAGINQDIAINVNGSVNAWKESGGSAGTFSPNAAFVQAVIPAASGTTYTAKLQWKAQQPNSGSIYAGAGPVGGRFSQTRLTAQFYTTAQQALDKVSTSQYSFANIPIRTMWVAIDPINFSHSITTAVTCDVIISANVDLWSTSTPIPPWGTNGRFNLDIGIVVLDTSVPYLPIVAPVGWKESGAGNGTFSPNAAYEVIRVQLYANRPYLVYLVWKANAMTGGTLYAGAGPLAGAYSPTRLTVQPTC